MTHPLHETNGASLEDCHTNFFAVTDLCGIKWRKLVLGEITGGTGITPLEDPVLSSFSKCLAEDILCVWRRVGTISTGTSGNGGISGNSIFDLEISQSTEPPPLSLTAAKELWIFWYGEEPNLSSIISPKLIGCDSEDGSWESGLSYECRSLLFKALHNRIERCLLSHDFVRLGKWFVHPCDDAERKFLGANPLSFAFSFFVHGESTVCACMDMRQHPRVQHLTRAFLQQSQTAQSPVKVILVPYGLAGTLTGQVSRIDSQLWDEWKQFYPIHGSTMEMGLPPLVDVIVGGVRMCYPSCYVLVTDMDELPVSTLLSPPPSPTMGARPQYPIPMDVSTTAALAERWLEHVVRLPESFIDRGELAPPVCASDFIDTYVMYPCHCSKDNTNRTEVTRKSPEHTHSCTREFPTEDDLPVSSMGSSASLAPSPLPTLQLKPASISPADSVMPALSPQPPLIQTNAVPSSWNSPQDSKPTIDNSQIVAAIENEITLKRPFLASKECKKVMFDDEQRLPWLYDFSAQEAWLNHPVKRFKGFPGERAEVSNCDAGNLYPPTSCQLPSPKKSESKIKEEPGTGSEGISDSCEFNPAEENNEDADALKSEKEDAPKPGSLFTSEGLQASYKDLDKIFDNSDPDSSDDEANMNQLQVQTPPATVKSGLHEETKLNCSNNQNNRNVGVLRPEELSRMLPTPPSQHNFVTIKSNDPFVDQSEVSNPERPLRHVPDIYPNMGSPPEELIDDWSYVFKPYSISEFVNSSKYAPLTNLPSQYLSPVKIPSHCVYRPSWVCNKSTNNSEKTNPVKPNSVQQTLSPNPSAALGSTHRSAMSRALPTTYDQASPATSTTSSYLNKNLNSIEPDTPGPASFPESNSLVVNILLGDTSLNIFRDHNFDSCSLCVCNAGPKVVGNIKGADAGTYLAGSFPVNSAHFQDDDQILCSCGFSAVVNRRLAHKAGLFYEDEMEITGIAEDPADKKKSSLSTVCKNTNSEELDSIPPSVLEILREQCLIIQNSSSSVYKTARIYASSKSQSSTAQTVHTLEFNDGNEVSLSAIYQGKVDGIANERTNGESGIHRWAFLRTKGPQYNGDIVRMMRNLQPLLQEAVQRKCMTRMWEAPYTVAGPLTWRQFHRLAGRGTDDPCEPQPIPGLVVGYDRDWLSLSPYALSYWEKLLLEPYAGSRNVAYVVVAPEIEIVFNKVKSFFRELSDIYEMCHLGKHTPITKTIPDGILCVKKSTDQTKELADDWFKLLGETRLAESLRLYAHTCCHQLAPLLTQAIQDHTYLDTENSPQTNVPQSSTTETLPVTPEGSSIKTQANTVDGESTWNDTPPTTSPNANSTNAGNITPITMAASGASTANTKRRGPDEEEIEPPSIVVYLIEPFSLDGVENLDRRRLAIIALLRAYSNAINSIPENMRANIKVQLISLESVMGIGGIRERRKIQDEMKSLALNVFLQSRRLLNHNSSVKSLTGFGTAAAADLFLRNKDELNKAPYRLYAPAYILAPLRTKSEKPDAFGIAGPEECAVLYVNYCLSEDQAWLLAVATDDRGEIFETTMINIHVPNRKRRKLASARRFGLQKLMDFILGIMSQGVQPWRLVVGRVGRIGQGELKGWSWLLSRKALLKASKHLKEICGQCSLLYPSAVPCVLSACLISLEPDSTLRLMADQFTPDERFSQTSVKCKLSTPHDVTCTHILVFPTSATTQSSQTTFQEQHINGPELGDDELFSALDDDMPEGMEGMGDLNDIFNVWQESGAGGGHSPGGSPHRPDGSPTGGDGGGSSIENHDRHGGSCNTPKAVFNDQTEEVGTLLQQPLALGYLVSTAPTGRMPPWFWSACPHLEGVCPVFLKSALHLHSPSIQQNSDDLLQQHSTVTAHPLDSQYTTDVLRYVLEGYNALSWLGLDVNTKDRLSCLPVHIQALMQLYHATAALV